VVERRKGKTSHSPLDIIVEAEIFAAILLEKIKTVRSGKILELNQNLGPLGVHGSHELVHKREIALKQQMEVRKRAKKTQKRLGGEERPRD